MDRVYRSLVVLALLCVVVTMSAQSSHLHSRAGSGSVTHCTLCKAVPVPFPVSIVSAVVVGGVAVMVEWVAQPVTPQSAEGSNLSVRPPPSSSS